MSDEEKVTEKKSKPQPKKNIERLKKIKKKREQGVSMRAMAAAGAAVAVVTVVAVAGGMLKNLRDNREETMRVETVAASLETTAPVETTARAEIKSIVLETTLSHEEIASRGFWTDMRIWGSPQCPVI